MNYRNEALRARIFVATNLAEARQEAGLTQAEAARKLDATQGMVSRYESGRAVPSIDFLARVGAAYGCGLARLVEGLK